MDDTSGGVMETTDSPSSRSSRFLGLILAARPGQWLKNAACFAGLIFSGRLFQAHSILRALAAFAGFCVAASAVYLLNDVFDRELDRLNPLKRKRPIASGLVPITYALAAAAVFALAAFASATLLSPLCAGLMSVYLVMNVAYSARMKHAVLLDVGLIAFGFVLRVLYGCYAVEVKPTSWIALCMFFLAMFLGFAKRRGEMHGIGDEERTRRPVLAKYRASLLDMLLAMTGTMAIICYALYTVTGHQGNATLVMTVPLVTYGVTRYMLLVIVHGKGEAPERLLVSDPLLIATAIAWMLLCVVIIYGNLRIFEE
jgi:4-hydroxybenzoate polyprenyltransferase